MVEVEGGVEGKIGGVEYRLHRPRLLLLTGLAGAREMLGGADAIIGVNARKLVNPSNDKGSIAPPMSTN